MLCYNQLSDSLMLCYNQWVDSLMLCYNQWVDSLMLCYTWSGDRWVYNRTDSKPIPGLGLAGGHTHFLWIPSRGQNCLLLL